jgi:hypothetical protein
MYINTEGGSWNTGTCALSLLSKLDFSVSDPVVWGGVAKIDELETGGDADKCPDIEKFTSGGSVTLTDYPFAEVSLDSYRCNNSTSFLNNIILTHYYFTILTDCLFYVVASIKMHQ